MVSVFCKHRVAISLAFVAPFSILSGVAQTVAASPTSLSFGNVVLSTASSKKNIVLKNGQSTSIAISGITLSPSDYTQTNNCPIAPATLAAGTSCTISVIFTPTALGSRPGNLSITDTGTSSHQTVSFSGTGVQAVTANPTSISFGNQPLGQSISAGLVTVKNNQSKSLTIFGISTNLADYTFTTSCPISPATLAATSSCTISVVFTPTVAGTRNATLTISDNASVSPTVSLSGTGIVPATVSPTSLSFSSQALGTTSSAKSVTLTNNQSSALSITTITSSTSDFSFTSNCPLSPNTLAAKSKCTASVVFSPKAIGSRTGTLSFNTSANNTPQTVVLTGTGAAAKLTSLVITPSSGSVAVGQAFQFTATGNYSDGSTQNLTGSANWTSSATAVSTIGSAGLATGRATGTATVTATSGAVTASATLNVSPPVLVSLAVTPASGSIALGTTQQFSAVGTYSDGSTLNLTNSVGWNSTNAGIAAINAQGLVTGVAVGSASITASSGAITGSTNLNVTPAALVSLAITPATPSVALGITQQFTATGTFTDKSTQDLTKTVQWSSSAPAIATISNATNTQGLASTVGTGASQITASSGSITGNTTIHVTAAALESIAVTPANPSIALGTTQQFVATGMFSDGSTQDLSSSVTWTSDNASSATVNTTGLATSTETGTANISATSAGLAGSTTLTVTAAALVSIAVNPPVATVPLGATQQFTATGTYTDSTTQDLTTSGHWSSSAATIATISNSAGTAGLTTTFSSGNTAIGIAVGSVNGSATLKVNPAALVSITINPQSPTIPLGTTQSFTATGNYTDGTIQDMTSVATWSSSAALVAIVSNSSGTNGLATSAGVGTASITAASGSISSSTNLTVGQPALVSITVSPSNITIPLGSTQQFTASGTYTDGSIQDITASATWVSSSAAVASSAPGGLVSSNSQGSVSISATSGPISGSAALTVSAPALVALTITPASAAIPLGTTQQFSAFATFTDGSTQNVTGLVNWTSSAPGVATVSGGGLATGLATGGTTVTAASGSVVASTNLVVTKPILTAIAISPASSSLILGTSLQLSATGTFSDNSTQDLTNVVAWSVANATIATVGNQGLATSLSVGTTAVTATSGTVSGSATLNVTPPVLVSLAITPALGSIALGTTQQFSAVGTYTDGSTLDLTSSVSWSGLNPAVFTVNNQGLATSVAVGSASVIATSGTVTGSTTLNVTPAALVSLAITPAIPSVALGITQQFSATGTFTDGSTQDLTNTVQWSSSAPAIATISNTTNSNGLASTVGTGSAQITASSGSVSGNTTINVTAAVLESIAVTPANPSIALGTTQQFVATGTFSDGSTQDLSATATWASDTLATVTVNKTGLATSIGTGTANVTAASGTVTGSTGLTVTAAALVSIAINPPVISIPLGATQQFTASGTYTDSTTQDLTTSGHWSSTAATVATISNSVGSSGVATTLTPGTTTIGISSGSVNATAMLTVSPATLVSIAINPQSPAIALGTAQPFTAIGTYTDGTTQDLTSVVSWSSSSALVAIISNSSGTNGLATGASTGSAAITATSGSVSASTTLTVGQPSLASIAINPSSASIPVGTTQQFTAIGTYTDGTTQDVTTSVSWSSSSPAAQISNAAGTNGLASGTAPGIASITAVFGSLSASGVITVNQPSVISLSVAPTYSSLIAGSTQQFTATATYSNGSLQDVTQSVNWSSSSTHIAAINSTGIATGLSLGTASISATFGSMTASVPMTVIASSGGANSNCSLGDVHTGPVSDGPAALPTACVYTGSDGTPTPGNLILVRPGASVTTALGIAQCGDTIELAAGASFAPFNLPAKACDPQHWIQIRTDAADILLPAEGVRINPSYAGVASLPDRPAFGGGTGNVMAQVVAIGTGYAITVSPGANFYRIGPGIEITRQQGNGLNYGLVSLIGADHIIFDRVWDHGSPVLTDETKRGMDMSGATNTAVVDSYFNDFKCISNGHCTEAQAIVGGNQNLPQGPHKIFNNFLEAATEVILFGGGSNTATVPTDIEIRRNHLYKPPSWNPNAPNFIGTKYVVKNHMEFKNARRVLFENNYLENTWGGFSQTGFTILMTPRGDWAAVEDITVRYVHSLHVGSGFQLAASTCGPSTNCATSGADALAAGRFSIHDILIEDMNPTLYTGSNQVAQISSSFTINPPLNNVSLDHITVLNHSATGNIFVVGSQPTNPQPTMGRATITNSIFFTAKYPAWSTGSPSVCAVDGQPLKTFTGCFSSFNVTDNLVVGYNAPGTQQWGPWPAGNAFPVDPNAVFLNYNGGSGGDYHVAAPYQGAGLDGKDIGADINTIGNNADTAK